MGARRTTRAMQGESGRRPSTTRRRWRRRAVVPLAMALVLGACDFEQEVQEDGPSLWFRFGEATAPHVDLVGGRVADVAGTAPELVVARQPSDAVGGDEWAVAKTAAGDAHLVVAPAVPTVDALDAAGGVTVEAWVTPQAEDGTHLLARRGSADATDWAISQVGGQYRFEVFDEAGVARWSATGGTVEVGVGQQVVGTFDDGGATGSAVLWVDGVSVATSGEVAGDPRTDDGLGLRLLEGGPAALDELIGFDDEVLAEGRVLAHHVGGTSEDPCDVPLAEPVVAPAPQTVLDTAADIGATQVQVGAPVDVTVGAVAGVEPAAIDVVELAVTGTGAGLVRVWPTGWDRPGVANVLVEPGRTTSVAVPVGEATSISVEPEVAGDLRIEATAAWTGGELRPASGVAAYALLDADEDRELDVTPHVPAGAGAVLLSVMVDATAPGTLTVPVHTDPELGGVVERDLPAGRSAVVVTAGVEDAASWLRTSSDAFVVVQVLGWAARADCGPEEDVPPALEVTSPAPGAAVDAPAFGFVVEGTASDQGSGLAAIDVAVDGVPAPELTVDLAGRPGTWSVEAFTPDGTHELTFTARDFAGNTTSRSLTVTVTTPGPDEVVTAPELLVPDQVAFEGALVSYDPAAGLLVLSALPGTMATIRPGTTIATYPVEPSIPDGLFHRVDQIQQVGGPWRLWLSPGSLDEVLLQITVDTRTGEGLVPQGPQDTSVEGGAAAPNAAPTGVVEKPWDIPPITACVAGSGGPVFNPPDPDENGGFDICAGIDGAGTIGMEFVLDIGRGSGFTLKPEVKQVRAVAFAEAEFEGFVRAMLQKTWDDEIDIGPDLPLGKIPIWGPIWLEPTLDLKLKMEARFQAKAELTLARIGGRFEAGIDYHDGEIHAVGEKDLYEPELGFEELSANTNVRLTAGPRFNLNLMVNGIAGGNVWLEPLTARVEAAVEASTVPGDPEAGKRWIDVEGRLFGRLGANVEVGVDTGIFKGGWKSGDVTVDLWELARFIDLSVDIDRACRVDACGHVVLPEYDGNPTRVNEVADTGVAVGMTELPGPNWSILPVWWDATAASPSAQVLPMDAGFPSGSAAYVSRDGSWAVGSAYPSDLSEQRPVRWNLDAGGAVEVGPSTPGLDWWEVCDVNDAGTVLLTGSVSGGSQQLLRWTVGGAPEVLDLGTQWSRGRRSCTGRLLDDGTVVSSADTAYGWLSAIQRPGQAAQLIGLGSVRGHDGDALVVGWQPSTETFLEPVVWDLDAGGAGEALPTDGEPGFAEGVDAEGVVYGVVGGRNARWIPDGGSYDLELLSTDMNIWDVKPSGTVYGYHGPDVLEEPSDDRWLTAPTLQWHDDWFVEPLGGGVLGDFYDRRNEGSPPDYSNWSQNSEGRTVYFGPTADSWFFAPSDRCRGQVGDPPLDLSPAGNGNWTTCS